MAQQAVLDQQRYKKIIHTCDFSSGCDLEIDPNLKQIILVFRVKYREEQLQLRLEANRKAKELAEEQEMEKQRRLDKLRQQVPKKIIISSFKCPPYWMYESSSNFNAITVNCLIFFAMTTCLSEFALCLKVQVHIEDDPERIFKTTEVS